MSAVARAASRLRRTSSREQVLLVLGACIVLAAVELLFRVLPEKKELFALDDRLERLEASFAPRPRPSLDPEVLRQNARRDAARGRVERARASVGKLLERFPAEGALVAVSELAERTNVLVRDSEPLRASDEAPRPRRALTVVATFGSLRAFVAGLASLPQGAVRLEKLEIDAVEVPSEEGDAHLLVATLVLVP